MILLLIYLLVSVLQKVGHLADELLHLWVHVCVVNVA